MKALAAALVLLATPADAASFQNYVDWAHCRLYPSHERCRPPLPAPMPIPAPAEPVQAPVPPPLPAPVVIAPPPVAVPAAPPVAAPAVVRPHKVKRQKAKPKWTPPPKRKRSDAGPDLPWPCWQVRLGALGKSCADLRAEGQRRGISLTPKQLRQAAACIGRCFPPETQK